MGEAVGEVSLWNNELNNRRGTGSWLRREPRSQDVKSRAGMLLGLMPNNTTSPHPHLLTSPTPFCLRSYIYTSLQEMGKSFQSFCSACHIHLLISL
jgi:hypothetical protein